MLGKKRLRIGVLTGGGDAPGTNAVLESLVISGYKLGWKFIGFLDGWSGVIEGNHLLLIPEVVRGIRIEGGTILFTSRTPIFPKKEKDPDLSPQVIQQLKDFEIDVLVVIGGDDTQGEGWWLFTKHGIKTVGVPKTMDRNLKGTEYTFGFDTAIDRVSRYVRDLHTTARSHHRVIVVEVFGRDPGWVTLEGGIGGGAHGIWIPEFSEGIYELWQKIIVRRYCRPNPADHYGVMIIAEGATDEALKTEMTTIYKTAEEALLKVMTADQVEMIIPKSSDLFDKFGHIDLSKVGIGKLVARRLRRDLKSKIKELLPPSLSLETKEIVLSHLVRSGPPQAFDVNLGIRFGNHVCRMIQQEEFGRMAALQAGKITSVSMEEVTKGNYFVPEDRWQEALQLMQAEIL